MNLKIIYYNLRCNLRLKFNSLIYLLSPKVIIRKLKKRVHLKVSKYICSIISEYYLVVLRQTLFDVLDKRISILEDKKSNKTQYFYIGYNILFLHPVGSINEESILNCEFITKEIIRHCEHSKDIVKLSVYEDACNLRFLIVLQNDKFHEARNILYFLGAEKVTDKNEIKRIDKFIKLGNAY
ncbi:MAG: hypothetical protein NC222_06750 [Staphylococcus sp.]|nr:hypothetical protein [Staphylococcus sp.]